MSERTPVCPRCNSREKVESNRFDTHSAGHLTAHNLGNHGNPVMLGIAGGLWLAGEAINAMNHAWKCSACDYEFTPEVAETAADDDDDDFFDF